MMSAPMIPRKPLAVPAQAHMKELEVVNPTNRRALAAPDYPQEGSSTVTANVEWEAPTDRQKVISDFNAECNHTSTGAHTDKRTPSLSLNELFSHTLYTFLPHQRYFHNHISRRTLLIMLAITSTCLLALIVGLAAGLPTTPKRQDFTAQSTGEMTYYNPALGACGTTHGDNDAVVAISKTIFDPKTPSGNPNNNPHCGRKIKVSRSKGNDQHVTAEVTVVDRCVGCKEFDLDVSPSVFKKLADPALGRVNVDWQWL